MDPMLVGYFVLAALFLVACFVFPAGATLAGLSFMGVKALLVSLLPAGAVFLLSIPLTLIGRKKKR